MLNIGKLENLYIEGTLSEYLKMCSFEDLARLIFIVSDSHLSRNSKQSILGMTKCALESLNDEIIPQRVV